jgi:hypothetical protein
VPCDTQGAQQAQTMVKGLWFFFCWGIPNQASTLVKMLESMTLDFRNMKQQVCGAYGM